MIKNHLEKRLRENAETVFSQGKEPPAGHRERFEQRLKALDRRQDTFFPNTTTPRQFTAGKKWLVATAAAAVIAGFMFLLNPFSNEYQRSELADVRNYYSMRLGEEADVTRQLIQYVDETHQSILIANVEYIENEMIPDMQLTNDDYIKLLVGFYTNKIEILQNLQNIIIETSIENI